MSGRRLNAKIFFLATEKFFRARRIKNYFLSLALVKDKEMCRLNRERLDHNYPTDVLAFNLGAEIKRGQDVLFGEIILDYEQIARQARKYGQSAAAELIFVFVHGLQHLAGEQDRTISEREAMHQRARAFLDKIGFYSSKKSSLFRR